MLLTPEIQENLSHIFYIYIYIHTMYGRYMNYKSKGRIIRVRNWAGFDPIHKPWPMDRPYGLSDK